MTKRKSSKVTTKKLAPPTLAEIFEAAAKPANTEQAAAVMQNLEPDKYTPVILGNLADGTPDVRGLLYYLASTFKPTAYLELGVRRGYSMAMVATASPKTTITGVDMWVSNYGGAENPGFLFVENQLRALDCTNEIKFLNGRSQVILPQLFVDHPDETYDLILVDADHTYDGALSDLRNTLPKLNPGGYLVFDDLHDPALERVWNQINSDPPVEFESHVAGIVGLIRRV